MSCIFFQTLKGRLPKYRGTWIKAPEGVCGSGSEIWTLEEHSGSEPQWIWIRNRETRDIRRSLTFPSWLETPAEQTHHLSSRTQSINQSINQWLIWNQTFRKQTSLAFIISSASLIVCERAEMCLFISFSFSFIICFFCSSSSLSAVIVASSSSLRNWWSFSNCCLIWRSVCSAWDWNQITFTSIVSINTHQHITTSSSKRNSDTWHITDPEADRCSSLTTRGASGQHVYGGGGGGCWCPPPYRSRSGRIPLGRNRDCVPGRALHGPQM